MSDDIPDSIEQTWQQYLETIEPLLPQHTVAVFCLVTINETRYFHTAGITSQQVSELFRILADQIARAKESA